VGKTPFFTVQEHEREEEMAFVQQTRKVTLRLSPNGPSRGRVTEIQRRRMLAAALEAVEEVGYARMAVAQVIGRAKLANDLL
jgi:hypothetical protein